MSHTRLALILVSVGTVLMLLSTMWALGMLRLPARPPCADCGKRTEDGKAFIDTSHLNGKANHAAHP